MSINAINIIPIKTDYCPTMDKTAVNKKMTASWGNHRFGDIVLYDFNKNGTADHIGIVIDKMGSYIRAVEGNTGSGSNTNGGQVQIRKRAKSTVRRFARPKYNANVTPAMIVYTALGQVGVVESPMNSNKVKYNRWFYGKNTSAYWCATFVCWNFGNVETIPKATKPTAAYTGAVPNASVKYGCKNGTKVKNLQKFLNWYLKSLKIVLDVDGECGPKTMRAIMVYQNTEGLEVDANFGPKSIARAKTYCTAKVSAKLVSYRIDVDLTNQIATVYGIYDNKSSKALMSEFVSTARKGCTTPVGNFKIQPSGSKKAKLRTAKMSSGKSFAEYLCRFSGAKCMHGVPYKERNTEGKVYKTEFNKLGSVASAGCVRMPIKLARYIYEKCPEGTPVRVFKGEAGKYPMGKPKKYTATKNVDPTK